MKKVVFLLAALLLSLSIRAAQEPHVKFMGLPMNGVASTFEKKLIAKGLVADVDYNAQKTVTAHRFYGQFMGQDATIFVYFNAKNKKVYQAKVVLETLDEEEMEKLYTNMVQLIRDENGNNFSDEGEQNGHPNHSIYIKKFPEDKRYRPSRSMGRIDIYRIDNPEGDGYLKLHIDYIDKLNYEMNEFIMKGGNPNTLKKKKH
ncbi:MAG: hypothetical protein MJZ98_03110 [Paludibacteraceae bacterium]|nr:hypothetical protein [Paludibacteraceae bacterium]